MVALVRLDGIRSEPGLEQQEGERQDHNRRQEGGDRVVDHLGSGGQAGGGDGEKAGPFGKDRTLQEEHSGQQEEQRCRGGPAEAHKGKDIPWGKDACEKEDGGRERGQRTFDADRLQRKLGAGSAGHRTRRVEVVSVGYWMGSRLARIERHSGTGDMVVHPLLPGKEKWARGFYGGEVWENVLILLSG